MRNIKLTIQYDGTRYQGWQRLADSANTIQDKIEAVLATLTGEAVHIVGSGRTDAGVHADNQVANFLTRSSSSCEEILGHCYQYLPHDIVVRTAEEVPSPFHARFHAKSKCYRYTLDTGRFHDVFARKTACHLPQVFDIEAMRRAAPIFIGSHDFRSFTKLHSKTKSTVRTITAIEIDQQPPFTTIRIHGDGFLYKMVRLMAGALIAIGEHSMSQEELKAVLEQKNKNNPIQPAPPHGLCLESVTY